MTCQDRPYSRDPHNDIRITLYSNLNWKHNDAHSINCPQYKYTLSASPLIFNYRLRKKRSLPKYPETIMPSGFASNNLYWETEAPLQKGKPTVLFIHASWMSSAMWEETIQLLAPQLPEVNLLRVDLNGHGKTTAGRKEYTLWNQAEDVFTLLV